MTREQNIKAILETNFSGFKEEVIDIAVKKIIEIESCGDAISRQAAIDACLNGWNKDYKEILADIRALPPVEQKQGWIACSEKLPEKDGEYLVTVKPTFKNMKNYIKHCDFALNLYKVDEYDFVDKKGVAGFYKYDSEYGYYEVTDIVAWMPLPEPYEGGEKE